VKAAVDYHDSAALAGGVVRNTYSERNDPEARHSEAAELRRHAAELRSVKNRRHR
jgi:hypothetical protein